MATPSKKSPAKPRVDYKIGTRVKVVRRAHGVCKGHTAPLHDNAKACVRVTPTGHFISVNVGTTVEPHVLEFRPSVVKAY